MTYFTPALRVLDSACLSEHLDRLYRAALGLCGATCDAEDLVQDTCVRVLARPRRVRRGHELGYLMTVLRHTWHSRHRDAQRRPATPVAPEDIELQAADDALDAALEARQVYDLVAALPIAQREAVTAVDVLGLSYKEAARALSVPEGTIMSRLSRGRDSIARQAGRRGIIPGRCGEPGTSRRSPVCG